MLSACSLQAVNSLENTAPWTRHSIDANESLGVDPFVLSDYYLRPFKSAIRGADARGVMCSYVRTPQPWLCLAMIAGRDWLWLRASSPLIFRFAFAIGRLLNWGLTRTLFGVRMRCWASRPASRQSSAARASRGASVAMSHPTRTPSTTHTAPRRTTVRTRQIELNCLG